MNREVSVIYPGQRKLAFTMKSDTTVEDLLERVFAEWNHGSSVECEFFLNSKIRSLSVNDIVGIDGRYFQCISIGWNEVSHEYIDKLVAEVIEHPHFNNPDFGPWFALNEVMWKRR